MTTTTTSGLPNLAEKYDQWKNGPMKGKNGVTHRNPGDYFSTPKNIKEFILFCQALSISQSVFISER